MRWGIRRSVRAMLRNIWIDRKAHSYHFIHIPKNGGQSMRYALALTGDVSLTRPYHCRYIDVADEVGRDLRFFSIVRNPWSRTASRYVFGRQNAQQWAADDPRREYILNADFETYVKERRILPIPQHPGQPWMGPLSSWFNQLEWIRDENGNVACDCLRLEQIDADASAYFRRRMAMPRQNVTRVRYDYRSMYTDELIEIIGNTFSEDIEYFGFDFEGPATRNIAVD
jgi:hypothetical protein